MKYVTENFKNFLIIKLHNNRCAKKKGIKYLLCYVAGGKLVSRMDF